MNGLAQCRVHSKYTLNVISCYYWSNTLHFSLKGDSIARTIQECWVPQHSFISVTAIHANSASLDESLDLSELFLLVWKDCSEIIIWICIRLLLDYNYHLSSDGCWDNQSMNKLDIVFSFQKLQLLKLLKMFPTQGRVSNAGTGLALWRSMSSWPSRGGKTDTKGND